ncbi:MAG TPA: phosphate ABC transporter permease subunit PstC [Solirubrobacteraceae bacterium]|jgi:phosphate transport system permease protein|nr:phosphate ABC transporter permease subunit PstC [Solirubrobacteraceae bacterium]
MSATASTAPRPFGVRIKLTDRIGEPLLRILTSLAGLLVVVLLGWIAGTVFYQASPAISRFQLGFITSQTWDSTHGIFGAADFIYGTVVSSFIALLIATPTAIAISVYLTELAPRVIRRPVAILVELLAAIPSVILGLWGILILGPFMGNHLEPFLHSFLGWIPLFGGIPSPFGMLPAALILTIMALPIITSITREVFQTTPTELKEGAYALGATRWEMVRTAVLPVAKPGITGAVILGLGRALGEAIAVTQVIGNATQIKASLFAPAGTLAAQIASEYQSANPGLWQASLLYLAAILLVISLIVNIVARLIVRRSKVS